MKTTIKITRKDHKALLDSFYETGREILSVGGISRNEIDEAFTWLSSAYAAQVKELRVRNQAYEKRSLLFSSDVEVVRRQIRRTRED